jgi:hypothetical protein
MIDQLAGEQGAYRCADSHRGRDSALGQIESAAAAHDVGDDQRRQRPVDSRPDSVEQLDADEPERIVRQRIEGRANRQDGEGDEKDRPAPPCVGVAADEDRDRKHYPLRGDHAERHHRRRLLRKLKRRLLPDQWQQRRVGEMEQHRAKGENHQRTRLKQDPIPGRGPFGFVISGKVSRPVVVDRVGWNGEHRGRGQGREDRNHQKDGALGEGVADRAGQERDRDIAAVVKRRVAAEAARELVPRHQAEGERRNRRSEGVAGDRQDAKRDRHWPESRSGEYDRRGHGHGRHRQADHATLGAGHVDRGADRGLKGDAKEAACGRHQPDIGLGPMPARDQEHVDERSEQVANIGGKEIERVKRIRDRDHRRPNRGRAETPRVETFLRSRLFRRPCFASLRGRGGIWVRSGE